MHNLFSCLNDIAQYKQLKLKGTKYFTSIANSNNAIIVMYQMINLISIAQQLFMICCSILISVHCYIYYFLCTETLNMIHYRLQYLTRIPHIQLLLNNDWLVNLDNICFRFYASVWQLS